MFNNGGLRDGTMAVNNRAALSMPEVVGSADSLVIRVRLLLQNVNVHIIVQDNALIPLTLTCDRRS